MKPPVISFSGNNVEAHCVYIASVLPLRNDPSHPIALSAPAVYEPLSVIEKLPDPISDNVAKAVADKYGMDTRSKRKSLFRQLKEYGLWEVVKLRDGMKGPPAATPSQWLTVLNRIIAGESIREAIGGLDMTRTAVNSFLKKFGTSPGRIKAEGLPAALQELLQQAIDIEPPRTNPWYWSY